MRRMIFSISVTLDGFIDHTAMIADEESHKYFADELDAADTILFGRVTYQLLADYWPSAALDASLTKGELEFAHKINSMPKIVFSKTLEKVDWNTRLVREIIPEEILRMKQEPGKDLFVAGAGLASTLMQLGLIDEYRLLAQPIILGNGKPLFRGLTNRLDLKLIKTRTFDSGVVLLQYEPA